MKGTTAVVSGAASGIGQAVAERLLAAGSRVIPVDRDPKVLSVFPNSPAMVLDVRVPSDRRRLYTEIETLDLLVNAAGIIRIAAIDAVTPTDWDDVMEINAKAVFFLIQSLMPLMKPGSAIVNIASSAGKTASTIETAPYNASKAAVIALTKTYAYAYAPRGIRVNCVCPGTTATPMHHALLTELAATRGISETEVDAAYNRTIPLARTATPGEVASVVMFLLSNEAAYMTGQAVNVTGGLVMY